MSRTQGDAGPDDEDEIDATDDRGRRWYQFHPANPRRTDYLGVNSTWWMAAAWVIVILVVVFEFV
jgi:hypothetical protein